MDKSEPTLVPQWLKSSGSITGGVSANNHFSSSSLCQDDNAKLKPARNKSSVNISDNDSGRSSFSDRTTSSYFRRSSGSNGSGNLRSYGSFGRTTRDRDWDKDIYKYHGKEKSVLGDNRHRNYSDPLGSIFPSRLERDGLKRTQSSTSSKNGEPGPRKLSVDSSNASKNNPNNGNFRIAGSSPISNVNKAAFDRDFPSLGVDERQTDPETRRVPSPGLSTAIQSLPIGSSAVIGDGGWTSALAEVPVIVVGHGTSSPSAPQAVLPSSASVVSIAETGLNMAETLAQGPPRAQVTPQLSVETQRLEELAIKQSRQLIPVTPSMPKSLALNSSDKPKPKVGQQQHQTSSVHFANHSPRGAPTKSDISKASSLGKLQVLKPARDRNGISCATKDSLSPKNGSKVTNNSLTVAQAVTSVPLWTPVNCPHLLSAERNPAAAVVPSALEKRPTPQKAKSRNDFFNLVRKKSMMNSSSVLSDLSPVSASVLDKTGETEAAAPLIPQSRDSPPLDRSGEDHLRKYSGDLSRNAKGSGEGHPKSLDSGDNHSMPDVIHYSEEEEAAFLRSLGWDESSGEDEGLTEEEINAFYRTIGMQYMNLGPSFQGTKPKP